MPSCGRGRCIGPAGSAGSCPHGHDAVIEREGNRVTVLAPPCCSLCVVGIITSYIEHTDNGPPAVEQPSLTQQDRVASGPHPDLPWAHTPHHSPPTAPPIPQKTIERRIVCDKCGASHAVASQEGVSNSVVSWPCSCGGRYVEAK